MNVGIIQDNIQETFDTRPTPERVWLAMKHQDLMRKTRDFLWKSVQGAYKIGPYWSHIAGYEDRAVCPNCNEMEDLDHILLRCWAGVCEQAWNLADRIWAKRNMTAIPKTIRTILGCMLATFNTNGKKDKGKGRLFRILISETAYLIWRLRNERRIQQGDGPPQSESKVQNRWTHAINKRLTLDRMLTNVARFKSAAIKEKLVKAT